jgi:single-stranded-DNA-specific exonuclease
VGDVNVVDLMTAAREVFTDFGGHESSGGFSIAAEKIHELAPVLEDAFIKLATNQVTEPQLSAHDGLLTLSEVSNGTYESLRLLAPFGIENEKPVFRFPNVTVDRVLLFGSHQEHARIALSDESGASVEAISFFITRTPFRDEVELLSPGDRVTLDACIEKSHFMGRTSLRLRIENLKV